MIRLVLLAALMAALVACSSNSRPPTNARPTDSVERPTGEGQQKTTARQQAKQLVAEMTLEEKIAYLGGDRSFYIRPIERLGIPEIKLADGPVGCRNWGPSTAYPASIGLAASFDPDLTRRVGEALGRDCRARGVHLLLAPGVNIQRSPLNGRNFEYLGEDPLVASRHAVAFIEGVQSQEVLSTVKHYVANNQEWDRHHVSSEVSERALREIYLPAFEAAVKKADVGAVMTSYNLINGLYGSHHPYLLREVLRQEWGFDGLVMSDWHAVHDTLGAVRGGTDLEMPDAVHMNQQKLEPLLQSGEVKEQEIDQKVENILARLIRAGFFERPQAIERPQDDPKSARVALDAARSAIVLLKNEPAKGNETPLLPLRAAKLKRIAVIGPNAHPAVHGGSGSAYTDPVHAVSLLDAIKQAAPEAQVVHHPGIQEHSGFGSLGRAVFSGPVEQSFFAGKELEGKPLLVREVDRVSMLADGKPPAPGVPAENYSIRWKGQIDLDRPGNYQVLANADDGIRVFIHGKKVLDDWSDHAPRMSETTLRLGAGKHDVVVEYFQGILGSVAQFGIGPRVAPGQLYGKESLRRVLDEADVVLLAVGYGQHRETNSLGTSYKPFWPPGWARDAALVEAEDDDRTFVLPKAQRATLEFVAARKPRSVVIGFAGGGIDFEPWLKDVPALLWAWYPGQEGGTALAEVLFGQRDPGGRLPVTFAKDYADHPAAPSYGLRLPLDGEQHRATQSRAADLSGCEGKLEATITADYAKKPRDEGPLVRSPYCEGVFVGYRGFDEAGTLPLFPFGYGLSYAEFAARSLALERGEAGRLWAVLQVENVSKRPGRYVAQFYAAPTKAPAPVDRPPQQLAGFVALDLDAGESKKVRVPLSLRAFGYYDTERETWVVPAGNYEVRASRSSRDHELRETITLPRLTEVPVLPEASAE